PFASAAWIPRLSSREDVGDSGAGRRKGGRPTRVAFGVHDVIIAHAPDGQHPETVAPAFQGADASRSRDSVDGGWFTSNEVCIEPRARRFTPRFDRSPRAGHASKRDERRLSRDQGSGCLPG